jgi:octaprenyl-diphosphate synthase
MDFSAVQRPVRRELRGVEQHLRSMIRTSVPILNDVGGHVLAGVGKKFRPTLLLLVASLRRRPGPDAVLCAAVIESVHAAALIHDDSVDRSLLRRGLPTVNGLWTDQMAIIMGDFLYAQAMSALVEAKLDMAMQVLARVVTEMSCGEALEYQMAGNLEVGEDQYLAMIHAKTASLIGAACEIGAGLEKGAREARRRRYRSFGEKVGLAFQIADDLLDYLGEPEVTGKPVAADLAEGKMTLPLIAALGRAGTREGRRLRRLLRQRGGTRAQWDELCALIGRCGGFDYARARAERFAQEARALLAAEGDAPARRALALAVDYAVHRDH